MLQWRSECCFCALQGFALLMVSSCCMVFGYARVACKLHPTLVTREEQLKHFLEHTLVSFPTSRVHICRNETVSVRSASCHKTPNKAHGSGAFNALPSLSDNHAHTGETSCSSPATWFVKMSYEIWLRYCGCTCLGERTSWMICSRKLRMTLIEQTLNCVMLVVWRFLIQCKVY